MTIVTSTSSYLNRKTPGVYVTEIEAFGTGIVGVQTAVPIFVGYTEFAGDPTTGKPLYNVPTPISSMIDYVQYFGGPAPADYVVTVQQNPSPPSGGGGSGSGSGSSSSSSGSSQIADAPTPSFYANFTGANGAVAMTPFLLEPKTIPGEVTQFNLYWSMMAFFANGGTTCYVVSAGSYWPNETPTTTPDPAVVASRPLESIQEAALEEALGKAGYAIGPTMTVIPEACLLDDADYGKLVQTMLTQASVLQDRVAILDLPECLTADTDKALVASQAVFADAIAPAISAASYGAAYAPAIVASVVTANNILYTNLAQTGDNSIVNNILTTQAVMLYGLPDGKDSPALDTMQQAIASAFPLPTGAAATNTAQYSNNPGTYPSMAKTGQTLAQWQLGLDNLLLSGLPIFKQIETLIAVQMNILPPSGFLAGVWSASDSRNGVWNAPANIALASAIEPLYAMSDDEQAGFNVPTNGQAINIVRSQPSRGNVVWGARTLDGNSNDYRYIQIRRTLIYVEQSIKLALAPYVFAANDSLTWGTVTAAIASFLTGLWQSGGLMGAKPSEAFTVSCGLGSTMTAQNVLDGYMIVAVTLQMVHPAEFIELTFTQTMGS